MAVSARFKVDGITPAGSEVEPHKQITMSPVTSGVGNESYSKWTPSGSLSLYITNPAAFDQFEVGKEYDILISPRAE